MLQRLCWMGRMSETTSYLLTNTKNSFLQRKKMQLSGRSGVARGSDSFTCEFACMSV